MDYTVKPEEIARVLGQFDRQKESQKHSDAASSAREVALLVGTDTPLTVLIDIRHLITELRNEMIERNKRDDETMLALTQLIRQQRESDDQRHNEMLAFINKLSRSIDQAPSPLSPAPHGSTRLSPAPEADGKYYYKGEEIKTSQAIVGCVLLHLDLVVSRSLESSRDASDTVVMELKDWSSAVSVLREAESNITANKGVLSLPEKTSEEAIQILDRVASRAAGRSVTCKIEHIHSLMTDCPTISSCVEEIRQRALLCPGIISSSRLRNLSARDFPYATREGVLNISTTSPKPQGSGILHDRVKHMNTDCN